jgi:uncharacterized membrane protein YraQ (UPF0718 family)
MAQPNAGGAVNGGDCDGVLGGLALSSPDEEVSRGNAGEGGGCIDVWGGVSVGPNDAVAGKSVADDGELAGRESDWDDVFVFLFGPAALVFLAMVPRRRTGSKYLNTLFGAVAGMPMAVCTNCVAPIARGLYAAGMSRESVLAAMFASPALNVVVLAMTFALFPARVALLKLATVLFLIFVFAPAASREGDKGYTRPIEIPMAESWRQAIVNVVRLYGKSFWYVFRVAFPLMILGAVLGALVIEWLPPQAIITQASIGGIVLVALVGAFLPVPMAFDVAIAYIAMTHGAPLPYVVAILCTLGIISVFSLSVLGKTISWRLAGATYATVAALGIVAGVIACGF